MKSFAAPRHLWRLAAKGVPFGNFPYFLLGTKSRKKSLCPIRGSTLRVLCAAASRHLSAASPLLLPPYGGVPAGTAFPAGNFSILFVRHKKYDKKAFINFPSESSSLPGRHAPRAFCAAIGNFSRRLCRLFCCLRQPTAACGGFYRRLQSRRRTSYSVRYKMFPKRMLSSKTRCLTMSLAARVCAKNAGYSSASKYAIAGRYVSKNDRLAACSRPKHK